jgi:hypothetical protein
MAVTNSMELPFLESNSGSDSKYVPPENPDVHYLTKDLH